MSSIWENIHEDSHHNKKKGSKGSSGKAHFTMKGGGGDTHFHLHQGGSHGHHGGGSHPALMNHGHPMMPGMPMPMAMPGMPMPGGMPMPMGMHPSMPGPYMSGAMPPPGGGQPPPGSQHPSHHSNHSSHHSDPPPPAGSHHSASQHGDPPPPPPDGPPDDPPGDDAKSGSHHSSHDSKKKEARYKEPRHYGYAGGCFFVAGIPLIIWGAGSELIDRGVPLASDPKTGDSVTIKGFCTHLLKSSEDENECFTWTELSDQQDLPALRGMLKGYATVHNTHIVAGTFCLVAALMMLVMCFGMKRSRDLKWWIKDIIGWVVLSLVFGSNVIDWTLSQSAGANGFTSVSSSVRPVTDLACLVLATIGFWLAARKGKKEDPNAPAVGGAGGSGSFGSHHAGMSGGPHWNQTGYGGGSQHSYGSHSSQRGPHGQPPPW